MTKDEVKEWESVIPRVSEKIHKDRPMYSVLYYSLDMDRHLDNDNPVLNPTTTVRQELRKMGITLFVRLPASTGLTNYLEVGTKPFQ